MLFCGTRTKSAGLTLCSGVAITVHFVLAAGLRVVLERCLLASMLGSQDFWVVRIWAQAWLFIFVFVSVLCTHLSIRTSSLFCYPSVWKLTALCQWTTCTLWAKIYQSIEEILLISMVPSFLQTNAHKQNK